MGLNEAVNRSGLVRDTTPYYNYGATPPNGGMPYWPGVLAGAAGYMIRQYLAQPDPERNRDPTIIEHGIPAPTQMKTDQAIPEYIEHGSKTRTRKAPTEEEYVGLPKRGFRYKGKAPTEKQFFVQYSKRV